MALPTDPRKAITAATAPPASPAGTASAADADTPQVRDLYRQRSHLIAALAATCSSVICAEPGERPVIYVETPAGQLSWHLDECDLDLVEHVPMVEPGDPRAPIWDGHGTPEKYARLATYTQMLARGEA